MAAPREPDGLDRLQSEAEIVRLITRYAAMNDAGAFDDLAATFTEHGILKRPSDGEPVEGRANILSSFAARPPRQTRHLICNIIVDFAGPDTATARSTMLLYTAPPGPLPTSAASPALLGGFEDRLVRTTEGWRFAERRGWIDFRISGEQ